MTLEPTPQHSDERPPGLLVVEPEQGELLMGGHVVARAAWSGDRVCIFDQVLPSGILTPAHHHENETQGAFVVAGTIGFWVDGEEATVSAGGYVVRPAGTVHSLWNPTDEPARMLEITTPAEPFQRFQQSLRDLHANGGGGDEIVALAASFGTHLAPDVTAELCQRHGISMGQGYAAEGEPKQAG
jgi:mannose-6-phosphate isomerase-like protein (cupin superfamily)